MAIPSAAAPAASIPQTWLKAPLRQLGAFAAALLSRIESGDTALRKRYLRLFIDRVEVDDHEIRIRIFGSQPVSACAQMR